MVVRDAQLPEARDEPEINMANIEATLGEEGKTAAKRVYYTLVLALKEAALACVRPVEAGSGAKAWRALWKRYEPNTLARMQSVMSAILNVRQFPNSPTEYESKLAEWEELIRKYESLSCDGINQSVQKAIFMDKAPSSIKTMLQMQNLGRYEELVTVTLQYLQSNTKFDAGLTRRGGKAPDDAMEIDALTKPNGTWKKRKRLGFFMGDKLCVDERGRVLDLRKAWSHLV